MSKTPRLVPLALIEVLMARAAASCRLLALKVGTPASRNAPAGMADVLRRSGQSTSERPAG